MYKQFLLITSMFAFFSTTSFGMENDKSSIILFCTPLITPLVMENPDPNKKIVKAIDEKDNKSLRKELSNNTNPNVQLNKESLLTRAIQERNPKAIKLLLNAGANCTACDDNKNGLFCFFMKSFGVHLNNKKEIAILKAIVDAGCNVNTPLISRVNVMPLHKASIDHKTHIMQQLIELRAQVNAQTQNLCTPLHLCISHAPYNDIDGVQLLIKAGAEVNIQDSKGKTPLRYAVNLNAPYIVKTLLSVPGIKTSILSKDGKSDLAIAKKKGHKTIGRLLIQHLGVYSAQGRISRQGFAQILPQEIAEHIAAFLFRE